MPGVPGPGGCWIGGIIDAESIFAAYGEDLRSRRVTKGYLDEYQLVARLLSQWLDSEGIRLEDVRRPHLQQFFSQTGWSPSTQRMRVSVIKAAWRYGVDELECLDRPFPRLKLEKVPQRIPRVIPTETLRKVRGALTDPSQSALFHLFAYTGMRRHEVAGLGWLDVSFGEQTLRVIGKGDKERLVPMHPEVTKSLRQLGTFDKGSPWIFPGRFGGPATTNSIHERVKKMDPSISCHDFRRTVASSLEDNEAREAAIFQIMGWSADNSLRLRNYTLISQRRLYMEILKLYRSDPL